MQQSKGDEAYLKSETRRLIAEEEGKSSHEKSPSMQSASFKRISRACGTPVDWDKKVTYLNWGNFRVFGLITLKLS